MTSFIDSRRLHEIDLITPTLQTSVVFATYLTVCDTSSQEHVRLHWKRDVSL